MGNPKLTEVSFIVWHCYFDFILGMAMGYEWYIIIWPQTKELLYGARTKKCFSENKVA